MNSKKCIKCSEYLPATSEFFQKRSLNKDGLLNECKNCQKKSRTLSPKTIELNKARLSGERLCVYCNTTKPLEEFKRKNDSKFANPENKWTFGKSCNSCRLAKNREARQTNKSKDIKFHTIREALNSAKTRAKNSGFPFDIAIEDLMPFNITCPVLGIELEYGGGTGNDSTASIDKVIPGLGYVKGNVVILSSRANRLKGDMTIVELEKILSYMKSFKHPH